MLMFAHTPPDAQASPQVASMSGSQRLQSELIASYDMGLQNEPTTNTISPGMMCS